MTNELSTAGDVSTSTLTSMADAALLCAAGPDKDAAFREFYRRYHQPLFTFLLRRLPHRTAAEDALQESFLRLWRAAHQYDEQRGSVAALLFTIARNVATDDLRRRASRPVARGAEVDLVGTPALPAADGAEVGLTVAAAMQRLSAPHREVLDLAYWGDLTQAQIADALRIPLGTVKSRVFLALRGLRTELVSLGLVA